MSESHKTQGFKVGLVLIPGIVQLVMSLIIPFNEALWDYYWTIDAAILASAVLVIALLLNQDRRLTVWLLIPAALGIGGFIDSLYNILWSFFPQGVTNPPPALYSTGSTLISIIGLLGTVGLLALTFKAARQWGTPAAIGLVYGFGSMTLNFLDPVYGVLIHHPDLLVETILLDRLIFIPYLILMPLWVLSANTERSQRFALIIVPGIAYLLILSIRLFFTIPLFEGVSNMPSVAELTTSTLIGSPLMMGLPWVIQIGTVLLCGKLKRSEPHQPLGMSIASSAAA